MGISFKIAWRNIMRHRGKSLVIGIIIFLGAFIMTVGNGVLSGMDRGLKENIMNRFTGHLVVIAASQETDNVILTPMGRDIQVISGYQDVKKVLERQDYIGSFLPAGKGFTLVLNEEGDMSFALLLGVDFESYQKMFKNNVLPVEGRFLKKGERGVLVTSGNRKEMYDYQDFWVVPEGCGLVAGNLSKEASDNMKDLRVVHDVVLMGSSGENTTVDIRAAVKGIIRYEFLDDYWKHFNIIDIESFREAFHYITAADAAVEVPPDKKRILETENLDSLFGDNIVHNVEKRPESYSLSKVIGKNVERRHFDLDTGAYNLVFIKLRDQNAIERDVKRLNAALKAAKAGARAVTWKQAVGQLADMATIIRRVLFGFVIFIFFVAIIIIMNTLSMAAMERVSEIGMMRAVGAQKSFIGGMFAIETSYLSFIFGGAGIIAGIITVFILNRLNLTTENHILQLLYGGNVFRPLLEWTDIIIGIIELAAVTAIASLYPVVIARRITPLEAIARE